MEKNGVRVGVFLAVLLYGTQSAHAEWHQTNGPGGGTVYCFAISGGKIFAGATIGVFSSTNNGASWRAMNIGLTNKHVRSLTVSGTNLFAGAAGGGVWRRPLSEIL